MTEIYRSPASKGFTLVELLVSMAVFVLLAVMLFGILNQVNLTWRQAQSQIESRKNGRAILDYIGRELEMAALPTNRSMLYASATADPKSSDLNLQFLSNPDALGADYLNPHALFWQAPVATGTNGAMAEVGYFIRWDMSKPGNPRAMLCRFLVNSGDSDYLIYSDPTQWLSDTLLDKVAPGVKDAATPMNSYKGLFADNVIALWVRCLDPLGNPIIMDALNQNYTGYAYDSRRGYQYKTAFTTGSTVNKSGFKDTTDNYNLLATLPASVEIALVILDGPSASRLTQKPTYPSSAPIDRNSFWTNIQTFIDSLPKGVREGARVQSTRISLQHGS